MLCNRKLSEENLGSTLQVKVILATKRVKVMLIGLVVGDPSNFPTIGKLAPALLTAPSLAYFNVSSSKSDSLPIPTFKSSDCVEDTLATK